MLTGAILHNTGADAVIEEVEEVRRVAAAEGHLAELVDVNGSAGKETVTDSVGDVSLH